MIKNKKVLLICKESFSSPLFFIAQKLLEEGNEVAAFFIYPEESYFNKCLYNQNTYYKFKEQLPEVKLFGLTDLCKEFNKSLSASNIDMEYLVKIEKEYTYFKNLNLQLTSSQLTTRQLHNRIYFKYSSLDQNLKFIELGYKRVIEVFENFKPELILDTDNAELLRTILNEVAFKNKIPYITIDHPRFELFKIPTYCLGIKSNNLIKNEYFKFFDQDSKDLLIEYEYLNKYKLHSNIMSKEYYGTVTSKYKSNDIIFSIKYLLGILIYLWNVYVKNKNFNLIDKKNILFSNPIKLFIYFCKIEIKNQILFRKNKYFKEPDCNDIYIYMPLHLIPESTTFLLAPFYINELNIIEQVSKSLPIGWKLYVKEHQAMIGERSLSFYESVNKFPNVRMVQLNYYDDPKPWIEKSKGVITITGTAAYEAALLGKKSLVFGDLPFNLIDGITRVDSFEQLPKLISSFKEIDNIHSCAAYIASVKSIGVEIDLTYLLSESEIILNDNKINSDKFKNEVDMLYKFYIKAYAKILDNNFSNSDLF